MYTANQYMQFSCLTANDLNLKPPALPLSVRNKHINITLRDCSYGMGSKTWYCFIAWVTHGFTAILLLQYPKIYKHQPMPPNLRLFLWDKIKKKIICIKA